MPNLIYPLQGARQNPSPTLTSHAAPQKATDNSRLPTMVISEDAGRAPLAPSPPPTPVPPSDTPLDYTMEAPRLASTPRTTADCYRPSKPTTMATAVANQQSTLLRDPMPPTIAAVPQLLSGGPADTPPEPIEAVAVQLRMRANQYRPKKPTSLATAVASNYLTMAIPFRHPSPPSIAAIPPIGPIRGDESMRLEKQDRKNQRERDKQDCILYSSTTNESDLCFRHLKLDTDQLRQTINHIL